MVRQAMMRLVDADLRVHPGTQLTTHHERTDSCHVPLIGEPLQVEHHLNMIAEILWDACRPIERRRGHLSVALLRLLDPSLDLTNGIEVFRHTRSIVRPEGLLETSHLCCHRIEDAAAF